MELLQHDGDVVPRSVRIVCMYMAEIWSVQDRPTCGSYPLVNIAWNVIGGRDNIVRLINLLLVSQ